ncbi:MAG: CvpA family protein, partial [Oscillospiraceae bacterium]
MNIIIDVILAVVFLAIVIFAAKKGFVLSILEVAAFILAIVLAFQLAAPFSTAIYDGFMGKSIQSDIEEKLPNNAEGVTYAKKASAILDSIPEFYSSYAKKAG